MSADSVLVVDHDIRRRERIATVIEFMDHGPVQQFSVGEWQGHSAREIKAVFLCGTLSDSSLETELESLNRWAPNAPVFLYGMAEGSSLPAGALAGIGFPPRYDQLVSCLHRAEICVQSGKSAERNSGRLERVLVGNSPAIRQARHLIEQVAASDATVLILGESGTGKEVVAGSLHYLSTRRSAPFVPVNCGAIPGELLESELFGHEKGAFTGALTARQGRFEIAEGGTLFLDEIGDMPLPMQVKLLRVLQEKTFERVGSNRSIAADVRIVAATHRNLEEHIKEGTFREDLYYRLNVFPIEMPPLRERAEDIPLLASELINRLEQEGRGSVRLTASAMASLMQYPWPGNVRELANLLERLVIMYPHGIVDFRDLPPKFQAAQMPPEEIPMPTVASPSSEAPEPAPLAGLPREGLDLKEYLAELEMAFIQQALDEADGVVAHAANRLKMRRTTLVEKMRKYGLQRPEMAS